MLGISPLPLLIITSRCWIVFVVIYSTSLSLLNSELICRSCGSSGFYCFICLLGLVFSSLAVVPPWVAVVPLARHFRGPVPRALPLVFFFWCLFPFSGSRAVVPLDTVLPPLLPLHYRDFFWYHFSLSGSCAVVVR